VKIAEGPPIDIATSPFHSLNPTTSTISDYTSTPSSFPFSSSIIYPSLLMFQYRNIPILDRKQSVSRSPNYIPIGGLSEVKEKRKERGKRKKI